MSLKFPELPEYEYSWRSIQVEPIPHSGEKLTLGAILQGTDGAFIAVNFVQPSKLKSIFGKQFGARLHEAYSICAESAKTYYLDRSLFDQWAAPLEGIHLSKATKAIAHDLEDGLLRTARNCSSLSIALEISESELPTKNLDAKQWRKAILEEVRVLHEDFTGYFNQSVRLSGAKVPVEFSFISATYAAHFDAFSAKARQQALIRAQGKLWQLDQLRDSDQLFHQERYELLLRTPLEDEDEKEQINEFVEELRCEASRREIELFTVSSAAEAAEHIIEVAA